MERLVVDAEGKIIIPLEITQKYGLRPGDVISRWKRPTACWSV
jgi:bifunctional DNA-binding transcriptional regulator/antitoxin component of YhaV-PrlF toxin-antitoxin module